ncbi:hypothetical protein Holit_00408 [Hollandina sp. SP2]
MHLEVPKIALEVPKIALEVLKIALEVSEMSQKLPGDSQKPLGASLAGQKPVFGISQSGSTNPPQEGPLWLHHDRIPGREQD